MKRLAQANKYVWTLEIQLFKSISDGFPSPPKPQLLKTKIEKPVQPVQAVQEYFPLFNNNESFLIQKSKLIR
jgi:hypothetical protein